MSVETSFDCSRGRRERGFPVEPSEEVALIRPCPVDSLIIGSTQYRIGVRTMKTLSLCTV